MRAFVLARSDSAECDAGLCSLRNWKSHSCTTALQFHLFQVPLEAIFWCRWSRKKRKSSQLHFIENHDQTDMKCNRKALARCTFHNCFICTIFAVSMCHRVLVWIEACRCTNSKSRRCVGDFAGKSTVAQRIKFSLEGCKRGRWRRRGGEFNGCTGRRLHKESALSVVLTCIFQARIPSLVSLRRLSSQNGMILLPRKLSFRAGIRWNWNIMGSLFSGSEEQLFIIRCNRGGKAVCREPCWNVDREKQFSSETAFRAFLRTTNIPCGI